MKTKTNVPTILGSLIYLIYSFVDTVIWKIPHYILRPITITCMILLFIGFVKMIKEK